MNAMITPSRREARPRRSWIRSRAANDLFEEPCVVTRSVRRGIPVEVEVERRSHAEAPGEERVGRGGERVGLGEQTARPGDEAPADASGR